MAGALRTADRSSFKLYVAEGDFGKTGVGQPFLFVHVLSVTLFFSSSFLADAMLSAGKHFPLRVE